MPWQRSSIAGGGIGSGLLLQIIGVGIPAVVVLRRAKHDSVLGHVSRYTVSLAWHEVGGLLVLGVGAVILAGLFALAEDGDLDWLTWSGGGERRNRRRRRAR